MAGKKKEEEEKKPSPLQVYKKMQKLYPSAACVDFLSTGSMILDGALGGGYARGRLTEMFGPTGAGKSTILLTGCRAACVEGHVVVYLDPEWAVNESLIEGTGLGEFYGKTFFLHKTQTFQEIDDTIQGYLHGSKMPAMFCIDSADAMLPSKKSVGEVEDSDPGLQARLMTRFCQKYKGTMGKANASMPMINQVRMKFKARGRSWDVREDSAGGNAIKFYSDIRIKVTPGSPIENPEDPNDDGYGREVRVTTVKNKVAKMKNCVIPVLFGQGISNIHSLTFYLLEVTGGVVQNNAWFQPQFGSSKGQNIQGKVAFVEWIKENLAEVSEHLKEEGYL